MRIGTPITVAIAGVETALVELWIGVFAVGGALGTPHQLWYVELPAAFLVAPTVACVGVILTHRVSGEWRSAALFLAYILLAGNLCAFVVYLALSEGGV